MTDEQAGKLEEFLEAMPEIGPREIVELTSVTPGLCLVDARVVVPGDIEQEDVAGIYGIFTDHQVKS